MSTSLAAKPATIPQRIAAAYEQANAALHPEDAKRLAAALVEIAVEELQRNPGFQLRVRSRYDELAPHKPERARRASGTKKTATPVKFRPIEELVAVKRIPGRSFNLGEPLDPYFLYDLYGAEQFRDALWNFPMPKLIEAVEIVQEHHPKTKPRNKRSKEAVIEYLIQYVAPAATSLHA